jgi:uncharacterized DUF497 family protein
VHTIRGVDFEWDEDKAAVNVRKHGIDFADAVGVFNDPLAFSMPDDDPGEARWIGLGTDTLGRLLVVVYTFRGENIRIISARRATPSERKTYLRNLP